MDGRVVEEDAEREGSELVWFGSKEGLGFYRLIEEQHGTGRSSLVMVLQRSMGMGEGVGRCSGLGRTQG